MPFPQPIFQVRGTQLKPYYSRGNSDFITLKESPPTSVDAVVQAQAGAFGGSVINCSTTRTSLQYAGKLNWCDTGAFALLVRLVPTFTGLPSLQTHLIQVGDDNTQYHCNATVQISTLGKIVLNIQTASGLSVFSGSGAHVYSFTSGVATDLMIEWDGSATAGSIKLYQDGALAESLSPSSAAGSSWTPRNIPNITLSNSAKAACPWYYNEVCIFNQAIGAYAARTDFVTSLNVWGDDWTDPGVANVYLGLQYHAGLSGVVTGILDEPAQSDVRLGVAYYEGQRVGTYDGSDRWTDPGQANVLGGVAYKANSLTANKTGTLIQNFVKQLTLQANVPPSSSAVTATITQGDACTLQLLLLADDASPFDLTGATFDSFVKGQDGGTVALANSKHTGNPDQVGSKGKLILSLASTDTQLFKVSQTLEIITRVTQGSSVLNFHGRAVLAVLPSIPSASPA
jgi:hypothetical protein